MTYKRLLIADPKRSQINVRDRLAYLRTLLEWAAQEDISGGWAYVKDKPLPEPTQHD
jgi:hypothetical protein